MTEFLIGRIQKFGWQLGLLLAALLVAASPRRLIYDEPFHIGLAELVQKIGWVEALRSPENRSAAGPLYAALHLLFSPVTNLEAPAVRILNLVLFGVTAWVLAWMLLRTGANKAWAVSVFAIPFVWPTVAMALTEVPALAAFTGFLATSWLAITKPRPARLAHRIGLPALSGAFLGTAILGRQTYLAALPVLALIWVLVPANRLFSSVATLATLAISGWLFVVWGGLVPPSVAQIQGTTSLRHGILACAYVGAACLFAQPGRWSSVSRRQAISVLAGAVLFVAIFLRSQTPPAIGVVYRLAGTKLGDAVAPIIWVAMVSLGIHWVVSTLLRIWTHRHDAWVVLVNGTLLTLVATTLKISIFSSRYIAGLATLLVLQQTEVKPPGRLDLARFAVGASIGVATVVSYYLV